MNKLRDKWYNKKLNSDININLIVGDEIVETIKSHSWLLKEKDYFINMIKLNIEQKNSNELDILCEDLIYIESWKLYHKWLYYPEEENLYFKMFLENFEDNIDWYEKLFTLFSLMEIYDEYTDKKKICCETTLLKSLSLDSIPYSVPMFVKQFYPKIRLFETILNHFIQKIIDNINPKNILEFLVYFEGLEEKIYNKCIKDLSNYNGDTLMYLLNKLGSINSILKEKVEQEILKVPLYETAQHSCYIEKNAKISIIKVCCIKNKDGLYKCSGGKKYHLNGIHIIDNNSWKYNGNLLNGKFHGSGTLSYKSIGKSKNIVAKGNFYGGRYHGDIVIKFNKKDSKSKDLKWTFKAIWCNGKIRDYKEIISKYKKNIPCAEFEKEKIKQTMEKYGLAEAIFI